MMMMSNPATKTPVLVHEPKEPVLKWQWQRDGEYLSGFATEEAAKRYGRMKRWLDQWSA
jgi:hypothetical protein